MPTVPNVNVRVPVTPLLVELRGEVILFIMDHPYCVDTRAEPPHYDENFRRFILELHERHAEIDIERFAGTVLVPLDTLKDWLG